MARTKGALNKRTRAALHAAQTGKLGSGGQSPVEYLLKVMRDSKKPDNLRVEAAKAVAPYLAPKLSAMEIGPKDPNQGKTREQLLEEIKRVIVKNPGLKETLFATIPVE